MEKNESRLNLKSLAGADRPREKLVQYGRRHLTNSELLAILIGTGSKSETAVELSQRLLSKYQHDLYYLGKATVRELTLFHGLGNAKALAIIAAMELGRRRRACPPKGSRKITCSRDAFEVIHPLLADLDHEEFWLILLTAANGVIDTVMISQGGRAGTVADPKIVFTKALEREAAAILLVHNHPSGNLKPSEEDLQITRKLVEAGKSMDLPVLDHLIVTSESFLSLADENYI